MYPCASSRQAPGVDRLLQTPLLFLCLVHGTAGKRLQPPASAPKSKKRKDLRKLVTALLTAASPRTIGSFYGYLRARNVPISHRQWLPCARSVCEIGGAVLGRTTVNYSNWPYSHMPYCGCQELGKI